MSLVLISAAEYEAKPTLSALRGQGVEVSWVSSGIGPLAAAAAAERLKSELQGKDILLIGSCGTFGEFTQPTLVTAERTEWFPTCERQGLSYRVKDTNQPITCSPFPGLEKRRLLCSPNISLSGALPADYSHEECIENLEAYSLAHTLGPTSSRFRIVLGITNAIGADAHKQWRSNYPLVAQMCAEFIADALRS